MAKIPSLPLKPQLHLENPYGWYPTVEESSIKYEISDEVDELEIATEYLTEEQQLLQDEEVLRETLEKEARHKKEWEEKVKQEKAHDELFRPSTPQSSSRSTLNQGKAVCLNCMLLAEWIKTLEAKIKILKGTLEMEKHPDNHTVESTAILYELYNDIGRFDLE
uniref:Uncharacterized protein n=1 Tax=Tanacetum cinerariifolium TaxID=118510 RepID=A0A6L2L1F2_TANCI|nr:hypothetical protein [Tanacetum cinerariifolium]